MVFYAFDAIEIKIFLHWFNYFAFWEIIIYWNFKIIIKFGDRMIKSMRNNIKFSKIEQSKEKLFTLSFPLSQIKISFFSFL